MAYSTIQNHNPSKTTTEGFCSLECKPFPSHNYSSQPGLQQDNKLQVPCLKGNFKFTHCEQKLNKALLGIKIRNILRQKRAPCTIDTLKEEEEKKRL